MTKTRELYELLHAWTDGKFECPEEFRSQSAWVRWLLSQEEVTTIGDFSSSYVRQRLASWKHGNRIPIESAEDTPVPPVGKDPEAPSWEVAGEYYVFAQTNHGPFKIEIEAADNMAFWYSQHGADWSARQIRAEVERLYDREFPLWQWLVIKGRLGFYKDGHIFSPYTWDNTPHKEREAMVEAKMRDLTGHAPALVEKKYKQEQYRRYKKATERSIRQDFFFETFYEALADAVGQDPLGSRKLPYAPPKPGAPSVLLATFADLHYGAQAIDMPYTANYSTEHLGRWLARLAQEINAVGAGRVRLACLGDLIESATGLNKQSTFMNLERARYGANAVWGVIDMLKEFMLSIRNLDTFYGVTGNHDRLSPDKVHDPIGQVGLVIYEYLKRHTPYNVRYSDQLVCEEIEGVNMIFAHGDDRFFSSSKGKEWMASQLLMRGKPGMYNQVLTGHLHTLQVPHDTLMFQHQVVPSFVTGNRWSERNGWSSNPRAVLTTFRRGWPQHTIVPLGDKFELNNA